MNRHNEIKCIVVELLLASALLHTQTIKFYLLISSFHNDTISIWDYGVD
jgi:hypothetical protein